MGVQLGQPPINEAVALPKRLTFLVGFALVHKVREASLASRESGYGLVAAQLAPGEMYQHWGFPVEEAGL